jgi:Cu(I)/Ag(I) efflux system membrane fusion protein
MKRYVLPAIVVSGALVGGAVFRSELARWFGGDDRTSQRAGVNAHDHGGAKPATVPGTPEPPVEPTEPALGPTVLPDGSLSALRAAFDAVERIRGELAHDRHDALSAPAREVVQALRAAKASLPAGAASLATALADATSAAETLSTTHDLAAARAAYGELNRQLLGIAAADPRLQEGWHIFRCPMTKGFKKWFQRDATLENPYMGQAMARCGDASAWGAGPSIAGAAAGPEIVSHEGHGHDGDDVSHYTCSMHPSVRRDAPGTCPLCGMALSPVTFEEQESGVVRIDEARGREIGIRTGKVERAPMKRTLRAVGRVAYDETRLRDVTLKLGGWITKLHVTQTGQPIRSGQILFTLYSPELFAAQQEYLLARGRHDALERAAQKKLELWGLSAAQIAKVAEKGEPLEDVPFFAPAGGYVIEKNVVEGAAVQPGERLFRIAALDKVWVEAELFEADLPSVKAGTRATVELSYLPGATFDGKVAYVYPYLDPVARTGKVRVELPNAGRELKPDMFATVSFAVDLGPRLQIPIDAVVYTGPRRLVFVDLGEGRLRPQEVTLGARTDDKVEVLSGLTEGQTVVTSGNFLVAAESRIRSASKFWSEERAGDVP